jgi:spore maturation protein CgeB
MSTGDAYTLAFTQMGYETREIVANAESMQKRWAQENGVAYDDTHWLKQILLAQIKDFAPEVLLVFGGNSIFTVADLRYLSDECPSIRLKIVVTDAPTRDLAPFREYNLLVSNTPELVRLYAGQGLPVHHIHYGFDSRVITRINLDKPPCVDFGFAGSIITLEGYHNERERLLSRLVKRTGLRIWSDIPALTARDFYLNCGRRVAYDVVHGLQRLGIPKMLLGALPGIGRVARWDLRPGPGSSVDWHIARRVNPPVYGLAMFQLLHDTKVVLNVHIDISANSATNMRLFEATGVGTCLLTDWKNDLPQLYEPDSEVVTYRDVDECIEKARYLCDHEDERRQIGIAGQKRTLRDHTYSKRAEQFHELISQLMK